MIRTLLVFLQSLLRRRRGIVIYPRKKRKKPEDVLRGAGKIALFIATHNISGLKYFAKTIRIKDLKNGKYLGSGKNWKIHLNEFGKDVSIDIIGIYEKTEVESVARKISEKHNITESNKWANINIETGKGSGDFWSGKTRPEETKQKISSTLSGRSLSNTHKEKLKRVMSDKLKGRNLSDDHKKRLSEVQLGNPKGPQKKKVCPHCGKEGGNSMVRFHFDNCKEKK